MLARMEAEVHTNQEVMRSAVHAFQEKMDAWIANVKHDHKERTARQEKTEVNPEKMEPNPEKAESREEHQEVHKEEAAVKTSGAMKKRHGAEI
jgi:hypothetical protein